MTNYSNFYLAMLFGITFVYGMWVSLSFGFMTSDFFICGFVYVFSILLAMLYIREKFVKGGGSE